MADGRRFPKFTTLFGLLLLGGSIAATAYFFNRKSPEVVPTGPSLSNLDVVCSGRVDSEKLVVTLDPSQPGRVESVLVSENALVKKNQEILKLDATQYLIAVREATNGVLAAQIEIDAASQRFKQHPSLIVLQEKKLASALNEATANEDRLTQMREQASLSGQLTKSDIDAVAARVNSLKILVDVEKIQLENLKALDPNLEVRAAKAKSDAAQLNLDRANKAVDNCVLRAPSDGTILRLQTSPGATLAPGSPMPSVVFAPSGPLIVRAELEQGGLGRVRVGMKAKVRDDARVDSPIWTGRVKEIAGWVASRRSIVFEPGELNDVRTTEVIIELDPSTERLWIGQRMQIRISNE